MSRPAACPAVASPQISRRLLSKGAQVNCSIPGWAVNASKAAQIGNSAEDGWVVSKHLTFYSWDFANETCVNVCSEGLLHTSVWQLCANHLPKWFCSEARRCEQDKRWQRRGRMLLRKISIRLTAVCWGLPNAFFCRDAARSSAKLTHAARAGRETSRRQADPRFRAFGDWKKVPPPGHGFVFVPRLN